jgi:hypothetical protein
VNNFCDLFSSKLLRAVQVIHRIVSHVKFRQIHILIEAEKDCRTYLVAAKLLRQFLTVARIPEEVSDADTAPLQQQCGRRVALRGKAFCVPP